MRFSFVHAADLHLDAALPAPKGAEYLATPKGAESLNTGTPGDLWREAPFLALRRLTDFCIAQGASLLLLAGDVYDSRQGSLRARLELREACQRLADAGIWVFWARGNHDPLSEEAAFINWPDNVTIFSAEGQNFLLPWRNGALQKPLLLEADEASLPQAVLLHGISHAGPRESANLALRLRAQMEKLALALSGTNTAGAGGDYFSFGLLHCNVGGRGDGHENYAPCALSDLSEAPLDYWALGHIHQPEVLGRNPHIVYAGSTQGLHVRENGPRGCWLGRVEEGRLAALDFHSLAPLRWERLELNLAALEQAEEAAGPAAQADSPALPGLEELEDFLLEEINRATRQLLEEKPEGVCALPGPTLLYRLVLGGRSSLHGELRKNGSAEALTERLNRRLTQNSGQEGPEAVRVIIKDLKLETRPGLDLEAIMAGDNLVAETLRLAQEFTQSLAENSNAPGSSSSPVSPASSSSPVSPAVAQEYQEALQVLYGHRQAAAWLGGSLPQGADLAALAAEAAALCLDLFAVGEMD